MKKGLLASAMAILLLSGCAKVVVVKVPAVTMDGVDKPAAEGMFYALPKTVVRVGLKVDQTMLAPAPFVKFAAIFAPDGHPVCKEPDCTKEGGKGPRYSLQQGASFVTRGEPDPENIYMVKFVGSGTNDQTLSMAWNDVGLLSTASASVTNRTTDVVTSAIKAAAGMTAKLAYAGPPTGKAAPNVCPRAPSGNDGWVIPILSGVSPGLVANYCEMEQKDRASLDKTKDKDALERAAGAYANHVLKLAQAKATLLQGGGNALDPLALITKLDALISQQVTDLYLGSKKTETWEGSLDVKELDVDKEIPVLFIDAGKGICLGNAELPPDGKPCPPKWILPQDERGKASPVVMTLKYFPKEETQLFKRVASSTKLPSGDRSFFYRIPAQVAAELRWAKGPKDSPTTYGAAIFSVAQLGTIASLPADRHTKALSYDLTFLEATGGLKSFKLTATGGLDAATIEALSGAAGTVADARRNKDIADLQQQYTTLNLKDEICQIQKKYGIACTVQP